MVSVIGMSAAYIQSLLDQKAERAHKHWAEDVFLGGGSPLAIDTLPVGSGSDQVSRGDHQHPSTGITDLTEAVQDIVGNFIKAGYGTTVEYDDVGNQFMVHATGGGTGSTDPEIVRDVIGVAMLADTGIQITVNDEGNQIIIKSTAVLPTRQVITGLGLTGGGDLSANRTLAVDFAASGDSSATKAVRADDIRLTGGAVPLQGGPRSGYYLGQPTGPTVLRFVTGTIIVPYPISWPVTIDAMDICPSNDPNGGNGFGVLYNTTNMGLPKDLVAQSAGIGLGATNNLVAAIAPTITLQPGLYWIGLCVTAGNPNLSVYHDTTPAMNVSFYMPGPNSMGSKPVGYKVNGAAPATWPAAPTVADVAPIVRVRSV